MNGREFYEHAVPILCYHSTPNRRSFEMQMECIEEGGWRVIGLEELVRWVGEENSPRLPAVVITFDDCYRDQFTNAVPILNKFGYSATFFAVTEWIERGAESEELAEVGRSPLMGRDELNELRGLGFEVGCHTRTHRGLPGLEVEEQRAEIEGGKRELEEILGERARFLSYPYGQHAEEAISIAKACEFSAAVSTRVGAVQQGDDVYQLKRVCVPSVVSREEFQAQLTWIPQIAHMVHRVPHLDKVARALWRAV
jgi:peptidoglycan/xylan/chitin deacetylase (PgdA/CDA1 family)